MPAPSDPLSPLIELELELEAAAETERNILEQLQGEIAALEAKNPPQFVRDYLSDRLAALMRAWRLKHDCTVVSEAMKIGAVCQSPVICDAQKLSQRAKAAAAHEARPEMRIAAIERLGLTIVALRRVPAWDLARQLAQDRRNYDEKRAQAVQHGAQTGRRGQADPPEAHPKIRSRFGGFDETSKPLSVLLPFSRFRLFLSGSPPIFAQFPAPFQAPLLLSEEQRGCDGGQYNYSRRHRSAGGLTNRAASSRP
jgi:hypothetical protein